MSPFSIIEVWTLRAREDTTDARVTALSWRPDGKILAIGYDSGCVVLVDVEDANVVHEHQFNRTGDLDRDLSRGSNYTSAGWFHVNFHYSDVNGWYRYDVRTKFNRCEII